jgi:hypothetical protein
MSSVTDAVHGTFASLPGILFQVTIVYGINQTITIVAYKILEKKLTHVENSGWDNKIWPIIIGGPTSLMTAMFMTWCFMKIMGDPVGAKQLGITMLFSFAGLVVANIRASKRSQLVTKFE